MERERILSTQFPYFSPAALEVARRELRRKLKRGGTNGLLNNQEDSLRRTSKRIMEGCPSFARLEFEDGMRFSFLVFGRLREKGYEIPEVTEETFDTFTAEFKASERSLIAGSTVSEFNYPVPANYEEENPQLMGWFSILPVFARMGAAAGYDLHRRQFLSHQLEKGPFGK